MPDPLPPTIKPKKAKSLIPPAPLSEAEEDLDPGLSSLLKDETLWQDLQKKAIEPANKSLWQYFMATIGAVAWATGASRTSKQMTESTAQAEKWTAGPDYAKKYFQERGAQFVTQVSDTDRQHIRQLLKDNWGKGERQFAKDIAGDYLLSKERAMLIYRSEAHECHEAGAYANAFYNGGKFKVWISNGKNACDRCSIMNGQVRPIEQPFDDGNLYAHKHPRCMLPDTECIPLGGLVAAYRSLYDGPIIELLLSSGLKISITPNHPILTPTGFIPAKLLYEGSDVLYCPNLEGIIPSDKDHDKPISTVENIFNSLLISGSMSPAKMPITSEDFHGDGEFIQGEIDVIRADGFLAYAGDAPGQKHIFANDLDPRNSGLLFLPAIGEAALKVKFEGLSPKCVMRRLCPHHSLLSTHPTGGEDIGSTSIPVGNSGHLQSEIYRSASATKLRGNCLDRHAGLVEANDLFLSYIESTIIPELDSISHKTVLDETGGALKHTSQVIEGLSRFIQTDKVLRIDIISYHGYVYDLESISSYLIGNGVYISNCGCTVYYLPSAPTKEQLAGFNKMGRDDTKADYSALDKYISVTVKGKPEVSRKGEVMEIQLGDKKLQEKIAKKIVKG